jgi:hypothetical protein
MILVLLLVVVGALATWLVLRQPKAATFPASPSPVRGDEARIEEILQEYCRNSPQMISLHLPTSMPALAIDGKQVAESLGTFLEFFARRRARGILVAAGCGALSLEIVIADAGPDVPDVERLAFFHWEQMPLPSRMDLDDRLKSAHEFLIACGGTLSLESRLEGGVCLRCRIPQGKPRP